MSVIEQFESLRMPIGARKGQAILFVDLIEIEHPSDVLKQLSEEGYEVKIRYLELKVGLHVVAILKEFSNVTEEQYEALSEEWETLAERITPADPNQAVRLWCGRSPA